MKKLILMLLCILATGCSVTKINIDSIDNITDTVLNSDMSLYNRVGKGYKYYLPREVSFIETDDFNDKLYSNGNYYYLLIDVVSYYNKIETNYVVNTNLYYSKKLDNGFLEINQLEESNKYQMIFEYNYSRIEAVIDKESINETVLNSSYILSSIKYNDDIIKLSLDEEYFVNKETTYEEFKVSENQIEEHFLQYVDENEES